MDEFNGMPQNAQEKYEQFRDEIEKKLFKSVNRDLIIIIEFIGVFVIGWLFSRLWSTDGSQFALTLVFTNIPAVIGVMLMIVALAVILNGIRHILRYRRIYKSDFRRIQDRLSKFDIYMDIPQEDIDKYDNILKLIVISWKNREKNT